MFRLSFLLLFVIEFSGCASRTPIVSAPKPFETPPEGSPTRCADTSMVFRPEKGSYQFGLDPVETRKYVLTSRTFKQALVSADPSMQAARYRVDRLGNSAVLRIIAEAPTEEDAVRVCQALARTALAAIEPDSNDNGSTAWLANQREEVEREKQEAEQELTSFLKEHNLTALDPKEQTALLRAQFILLKKEQARASDKKRRAQLAKQVADLEAKLSDMVSLEMTYSHLKQRVEQQEQIRMIVREHETEAILNRLTEPSLNILESCAPTSCEGADDR